jgi:tetratricopeptide (TPR) repeat protein
LKQYEIVRGSQPNNSDIIAAIGHVQRRQGKFDEAIVNIKDAFELNPLSFPRAYSVGFTLTFMREYDEAEIYFDRAIKLAPDAPFPYIWKARNYVRGRGDTARAREVLEAALEKVKPPEKFAIDEWLVNIDLYDRRYEKALDALDRLSLVPEDDFAHIGHIPNVLKRALIYDYWDKKELAKEHYELACSFLKEEVDKQPREPVFHGTLGIAYAGLGRKDDAIRAANRAIELDHETPNADGLIWDKELARIYVMLGEYDKAIEKLDFLMRALPARISIPLLQIEPDWDPLRNHPRFQKLIEQDTKH